MARIRLFDTALSPAEVVALDRLPATAIPTLSEWSFVLLGGLLAAGGFFMARRHGLDAAV